MVSRSTTESATASPHGYTEREGGREGARARERERERESGWVGGEGGGGKVVLTIKK
jgi:general stress protein YciG